MDKEKEQEHSHCLCEALFELKSLQDFLSNNSTKYFGKLLAKLVGTDTIPFLLLTKKGLFSHKGTEINEDNGKIEYFETTFFRIEAIDEERCCALITLLRPLNLRGDQNPKLSNVIKLTKTSICTDVHLASICAIQPLDTELLKRQIVIEPKW